MKFVATQNFWSKNFKSQYTKGLTYTCYPGTPLGKAVEEWVSENKVKILYLESSAGISGSDKPLPEETLFSKLFKRLKIWQ
jgi:hypothetical protein